MTDGGVTTLRFRVNCTNKYRDVQYEESEDGSVTVQDLNMNKAWAVKEPSPDCVAFFFSPLFTGFEIHTCNNVRYLISPVGVQSFFKPPASFEVLVVNFTVMNRDCNPPVTTSHVLMTRKNSSVGEEYINAFRAEGMQPKVAVIQNTKNYLGVTLSPNWLQEIGSWRKPRYYNPVIDHQSYLHTTIYSVRLQSHQMRTVCNHLGVHVPRKEFRNTLVVKADHPDVSSVTFLSSVDVLKLNMPILQDIHKWTLVILLRLYNLKKLENVHGVDDLVVVPFNKSQD